MIEDENLLFNNIIHEPNAENNKDNNQFGIKKIQHNLIMMGFDIVMINKIIEKFKIKSEAEAIDYLIKSEDGMWNHPFIPKEEEPEEEKNNLLEQPKNVINSVFSTLKKTANLGVNSDDVVNDLDENKKEENDLIKINEDICDICGEPKDFHLIKEFKEDKINDFLDDIIEEEFINLDENSHLLNENIINNNNENNNINNDNDEINEEEEKDNNPNECKICMGDLENPIEIENCKHKFCQDCFHSYLVNLITNNQIDEISCPKNKCKNRNISEIFFSQFLTEQEYYKFRQFRAQNEIARDSKKIFCPLCDSYADIGEGKADLYDSNNPDYVKTTLKCIKGHEFCSCGRALHEGDCYHDEEEFKSFLVSEKIKKCPKCGFLIKKIKGCNHMTCGNPICRYEFCWLCMQEAVPNHFDYGPCADKQFFDPDSFSYQLKVNHPYLYIPYAIFMTIIYLIIMIICGMIIPGIGISFISYMLIFEEDIFPELKSNIKVIIFLSYICIGFSSETLIYIAWGLVFAAIGVMIALLVLGLVLAFLKACCRCIFFGCFDDNNQQDIVPNINNNDAILPNDIM